MKGRKKLLILLVAVIALGMAVIVYATNKKSQQPKEISMPPSKTGIKNSDIEQRVTASGNVQAADEHSIFIELSQEVEEVFAEVGDYVEEGQLLVTYDIKDSKTDIENDIKTAQINIDNTNIELSSISKPAEGAELLELETKVFNAKQALSNAEKALSDNQKSIEDAKNDMEYIKQMLEMGGASQSEYDDAEKNYNDLLENVSTLEYNVTAAKLSLESAEINIENGKNPLNDSSTMDTYKKQLNAIETAKINLSKSQDKLSKLTEATYSPISGTIIQSSAVEGQMLTDSTAIMKIADLTNLDIMAYVSEYDIAKIEVGQNVELTSDGIEDKIYHGIVTKIEPVAETQGTITGSETVVPVLVHITDNDELIKPGMEFDMEFIVVSLKDVDYIPISAVVKDTENDSYYVFVVGEDGVIERRDIEVGVFSDIYVQVLGGIELDEEILESPDTNIEAGKNIMDYATAPKEIKNNGNNSSVLDGVMPSAPSGGGGGMPGGRGQGRPGGF